MLRFDIRNVPRRALLAAAVALLSYGVTTIIKSGIDESIRKYSLIIDKANFIDNISVIFPISQNQNHLLKEQIALQKESILTLRIMLKEKNSINIEDSDLTQVISFNPHDFRANSQQDLIFYEFINNLDIDIKQKPLPRNNSLLDPEKRNYSISGITECLFIVSELDLVAPILSTYNSLLAKTEKATLYPVDLGSLIDSLSDHRTVISNWNPEISKKFQFDKFSNPLNAEAQALRERQVRTNRVFEQRCLNLSALQIRDEYRVVMLFLKDIVRTYYLNPLYTKKEMAGFVEIALYLMGILLALSKEIRGKDDYIT